MNRPIVLIVDDDPGRAAILAGLITTGRARAGVHRASNGRELQAYLRSEWLYDYPARFRRPAVIVMDSALPDHSSPVMLRWLSEERDFGTIPVIVLGTDGEEAEKAYFHRAHHHMVKPSDLDKLLAILEELLDPNQGAGTDSVRDSENRG